MTLQFVQKIIANIIGVEKPTEIGTNFSFAEDKRMREDDFFLMLEVIEKEKKVELIDQAWRFETVKNLVEYIEKAGIF